MMSKEISSGNWGHKLNTTRKGHFIEMQAIVYLMEHGYDVFWNMSPEGPADLIAWDRINTPAPVDVKSYNEISAANEHAKCADKNVKVLWYVKGYRGQWQFSWSIREAGYLAEQFEEEQDRGEVRPFHTWNSESPINRFD